MNFIYHNLILEEFGRKKLKRKKFSLLNMTLKSLVFSDIKVFALKRGNELARFDRCSVCLLRFCLQN